MYFLEQLVSEWFAYKGYFVCTNIKFGKRKKGGYEGEMDVVAFDPKERVIFHIETSSDTNSWPERKERFNRKFSMADKYYNSLFNFDFKKVCKIAIVGYSNPDNLINLGNGIDLWSIPKLMGEIKKELTKQHMRNITIPEKYSLLRAIQFAVWY